jgi:hypothetical protein
MSRCLEQRLPIDDCPLQEECINPDSSQFIKQLPPFGGRAGELRVRQLKKSALYSQACCLWLWVRHQERGREYQDRAAQSKP